MGKAALVTGASRGIGRGIALELAREGWDVAINFASAREAAEEAARACAGLGARTALIQADIADTSGHEAMLAAAEAALGPLSLLVNNAGVAPKERKDILEASEESFDRLVSINLRGPYFLMQKAARLFLGRPGGPAGMIININSVSAYASSTARGEYCVSKAGLAMATTLYADRLAAHGIPVYEVRPGIIQTDMTSGVQEKYDRLIEGGLTPIKRWGTPRDVGLAVAALARGSLPFSTGEVVNVDGGFHLRRL